MDLTLNELRDRLRPFADEREWAQFHTPRHLVRAPVAELGELCELPLWKSDEEVAAIRHHAAGPEALADEVADVLIYVVRLGDHLGVDLSEAVTAKIEKNRRRYPAGSVRGSAEKRP
jgi:dCTP diphosphatase